MAGYGFRDRWRPYVSVAQRRAKAERYAKKLAKQGRELQPVEIEGRKIAKTFWGKAWCDNLESYSDYSNRLPRGRTYVRNGSVIDLQITGGRVTAIVSGSEIYDVKIEITPITKAHWKKIKQDCSQSIDSLMDLLQGKFSKGVMQRLTLQKEGLFPQPKEINISCSCPDWAVLCKHAAAVLYGVGARLDTDPEMLFQLREVDQLDLISQAVDTANLDEALAPGGEGELATEDLGQLFGIDLANNIDLAENIDLADTSAATATIKAPKRERKTKAKPTRKTSKTTAKRSVKKKTSSKKKTIAKKKTSKKKVATSSTHSPKAKPRPKKKK